MLSFLFFLLVMNFTGGGNYEWFKGEMLGKINYIRTKGCNCNGRYMPPVRPLTWDDKIAVAAARHAIDMDRFKYFDHKSRDGRDLGDRIDATGYVWSRVSENIARGYTDIDGVIIGWLKSPSHCVNIMDPRLMHMGVAKKGKYWVQDFGRVRNW